MTAAKIGGVLFPRQIPDPDVSKITSGTLANARLSAGVSLLGPSIDSVELVDGTIANADISASAAIADSKLATISAAGKVADSALSANVVLLNRPLQTFTGTNNFTGRVGISTANPAVNQTVVRLRNLAPVNVNGDAVPDFLTWSGTLLSSNWVLTCAHALQGTNGVGGGVLPAKLQVETDDGQVLSVANYTNHPGWQKEQYLLGNDIALVRLATGVSGVSNYGRLNFSPLRSPVGVVIAGFGEQGDGNTGGNFSLTGGFWCLLSVMPTPGGPLLSIAFTATNTALISWPSPSTGFSL